MAKPLDLFIQAVESALHEKRMSKSDLARKMNVSPTSVNRYLGGTNTPGIDKLGEISNVLGVPVFTLLMSQEERAKWDAIRAPQAPKVPQGSNYRDRLIIAALALDEGHAKELAIQAELLLQRKAHPKTQKAQ